MPKMTVLVLKLAIKEAPQAPRGPILGWKIMAGVPYQISRKIFKKALAGCIC